MVKGKRYASWLRGHCSDLKMTSCALEIDHTCRFKIIQVAHVNVVQVLQTVVEVRNS